MAPPKAELAYQQGTLTDAETQTQHLYEPLVTRFSPEQQQQRGMELQDKPGELAPCPVALLSLKAVLRHSIAAAENQAQEVALVLIYCCMLELAWGKNKAKELAAKEELKRHKEFCQAKVGGS